MDLVGPAGSDGDPGLAYQVTLPQVIGKWDRRWQCRGKVENVIWDVCESRGQSLVAIS